MTILLQTCCYNSERKQTQDIVVFVSDTRDKDTVFKPTTTQIDNAELKLLDYLDIKTKDNQTIFVNILDGKVATPRPDEIL